MVNAGPISLASVLAVGLGGAVGGVARYQLGAWLPQDAVGGLPLVTLAVNCAGAFLLGVLARLLPHSALPGAVRLFLTVGFCGGFTTFSAFAGETYALLDAGRHVEAFGYVGVTLVAAPLAFVAGERGALSAALPSR